MYDTILVPVDDGDYAVRAAEYGRYLASLFDATVHLLHVVDLDAAGGVFNAGGLEAEFVARLESEGERLLERVVESGSGTAPVETAVVQGSPREGIATYADENDVDLLVMGTHGWTGVDRFVMGSVTEHVIRHVDAPVMTVRATDESRLGGDVEELLLPTDGSTAATAAVEHAFALAERTGARIHAVNVVNVNELAVQPESSLSAEFLDQLRNAGEDATEDIASQARDRGLDVVTAVATGAPASELLDYVTEHGVDLVAMGTTGRTGLNRYLLGSTTERVVRHAPVPVLAVRPPAASE